MRLALVVLAALALAGAARAQEVEVVTLPAVEDLSLPFWCDWGYDWDERCYWDDSDRLGVGGVDDQVWRSGLRFTLDALPPDGVIVNAELALRYDGTCVAPLRTTRVCGGTGLELDVHPILTQGWRSEREVEFGPVAARAALEPQARPGWLVWDLTDLVADWASGRVANRGVLVKLADLDESFDSSGPAFPSSGHPDTAARPRLEVWYLRSG